MNGMTGTIVQTSAWSPARTYALEAKYEFLKVLRMPGYAIPSIAFPAMFYLLFGVIFGRQNGRRRVDVHLPHRHLRRVRRHRRVALRIRRRRRHRAWTGMADAQAREPDAADGVLRGQARDVHHLCRDRRSRARHAWRDVRSTCACRRPCGSAWDRRSSSARFRSARSGSASGTWSVRTRRRRS